MQFYARILVFNIPFCSCSVVNVMAEHIYSNVIEINRHGKFIKLKNIEETTMTLHYDYMVFSPSLQENIVNISGFLDTGQMFSLKRWLRKNKEGCQRIDDKSDFVVYGNDIRVFSVAHDIISRSGNDSEVYIICPLSREKACSSFNFGYKRILEKVLDTILKLNVRIIWDTKLKSCSQERQEGLVTFDCLVDALDKFTLPDKFKVQNTTKGSNCKWTTADCCALICLFDQGIDQKLLDEIISAGLVFDSRLIVDSVYRTNDPSIYAVGPCAKFSKKYRQKHNLDSYDTSEVGRDAACAFVQSINESLSSDTLKQTSVTSFARPKVHFENCCIGKCFFSAVCRPGVFEDMNKGDFSAFRCVSTDVDLKDQKGSNLIDFCNVFIDKYENIVAIQTYSNKKIDIKILNNLIEIHASYLGDIDRVESEGGNLLEILKNQRLHTLLNNKVLESMPNARQMHLMIKEPFLGLRDAYASDSNSKSNICFLKKKLLGPSGSRLPQTFVQEINEIARLHVQE